jgi:hypothetical protein
MIGATRFTISVSATSGLLAILSQSIAIGLIDSDTAERSIADSDSDTSKVSRYSGVSGFKSIGDSDVY